jgi:hypothetical protein
VPHSTSIPRRPNPTPDAPDRTQRLAPSDGSIRPRPGATGWDNPCLGPRTRVAGQPWQHEELRSTIRQTGLMRRPNQRLPRRPNPRPPRRPNPTPAGRGRPAGVGAKNPAQRNNLHKPTSGGRCLKNESRGCVGRRCPIARVPCLAHFRLGRSPHWACGGSRPRPGESQMDQQKSLPSVEGKSRTSAGRAEANRRARLRHRATFETAEARCSCRPSP